MTPLAGLFRRQGLVRVIGIDLDARVEEHRDPDEIDHVWIAMTTAHGLRVEVSINTLSKRNRVAGFDPTVRVAEIESEWLTLPGPLAEAWGRFDYDALEGVPRFEPVERTRLETHLVDLGTSAACLEVWGAPYARKGRPGIHQIHSRRASCAVREDVVGQDGALKFFLPRHRAVMVLLKFCGQ